jgi:hypothetical protein
MAGTSPARREGLRDESEAARQQLRFKSQLVGSHSVLLLVSVLGRPEIPLITPIPTTNS